MPSITITLTDTPTGEVAVRTDFHPAVGSPCSPAQAAALEVISRTRREYGLSALPGVIDRQVKPGELLTRTREGSSL